MNTKKPTDMHIQDATFALILAQTRNIAATVMTLIALESENAGAPDAIY